jgi:hypothetical protein
LSFSTVFFSHFQFREHEFEETFEGELWRFKFYYRDPWDWLLDLVSDPTLTDEIVWYPSRKYLVVDGVRQRLRDEPYNSDKLWELQVCFCRISELILMYYASSERTSGCSWTPSLPITNAGVV